MYICFREADIDFLRYNRACGRSVYAFIPLCCYGNALLSAVCQRWTLTPNTNYADGQLNSANSVARCEEACIANASCNGFDWVPSEPVGRQCWLSGPWSGARGNTQGVTHYQLDRNCQGMLQQSFISCIYVGISYSLHTF